MKITILSVGKLKEKYLKDAISEYSKRLSKYAKFEIIEVPDEKAPENISYAQMQYIKKLESEKLQKYISDDGFVFSLVIEGEMLDSVQFSKIIENKSVMGFSSFYFIIGGSLGLSQDIIEKSNFKLSFSKMTFPHQLMRLVLVEQIYRAFRIIKGEPYHK